MPTPDFEALIEDDTFLVDLGSGVWLMDDHRWALKVWETERRRDAYTLIHADYHWDGIYEFHGATDAEDRLMRASSDQVARLVAEGEWIKFDSFIAPAIKRGLVHTVHFYCLQEGAGDNGLDDSFLTSCGARQVIHDTPAELATAQIDGPTIFDLCLDLFNRSELWAEGDLWTDSEIMEFVRVIGPIITAAELVTVSLSFNYSGTPDHTRHLASLIVPQLLAYRPLSVAVEPDGS